MSKGKLHELIAVDGDVKSKSAKILEETFNTFNKRGDLFRGHTKSLTMFKEADQAQNAIDDSHEITTTVPARLLYTKDALVRSMDVHFQKEVSNQEANADIIIDGEVLASNIPATYLLGLETELKKIRQVFAVAPTLDNGIEWVSDTNKKNIWKTAKPEESFKTAKTFRHIILDPAKIQGEVGIPAQIEKWTDTENVGKYSKTSLSGCISSNQKHRLMERVDTLLVAVKQARMRANDREASNREIGETLMGYLLGELGQ